MLLHRVFWRKRRTSLCPWGAPSDRAFLPLQCERLRASRSAGARPPQPRRRSLPKPIPPRHAPAPGPTPPWREPGPGPTPPRPPARRRASSRPFTSCKPITPFTRRWGRDLPLPVPGGGAGDAAVEGEGREGRPGRASRRRAKSAGPARRPKARQDRHSFVQRAAGHSPGAAPLAIRCPGPRLCSEPRADQLCGGGLARRHHRQGLALALAAQAQHRLASPRARVPARGAIPGQRFRGNALHGGVAVGEALAHSRDADCLELPCPFSCGGQPPDGHRPDRRAERRWRSFWANSKARATWPTGSTCPCWTSCRPRPSPATARGFIPEPRREARRRWWPGGMAAYCRTWA